MIEAKEYCALMSPSEIMTTILKNRGVENIYDFLHPSKENIIPYRFLPHIDEAARIVLDGIAKNKTFFINVDSDTDGVTSGAIIYRWLASNNVPIEWHVSIGKTHGTSDELIKKLESVKPSILIIVDSLDNDLENYSKIKEMGIQIIVLDHHDIDPEIDYSSCVTLVSSNHERYPNHDLSGAGVTWKFCRYCDSLLGTFDSDDLVDLAAAGIIADMMDMSIMENRAIARMGIENFCNAGMKKILGSYQPNAKAVQFSIAPMVNASCRYFQNDEAFKALIAEDLDELRDCLKVLRSCKKQQTEDIYDMKEDLQRQIEMNKDNPYNFIVIDTPAGISGLVASQVLGDTKKPTFVVKEEDKRYAGSARSSGVGDFRTMCSETNLCSGLGHPEAFGFFLDYRNADRFFEKITEKLEKVVPSDGDIEADAEIELDDIDDDLVGRCMEANQITGNKFSSIRFKVVLDNFNVSAMSEGKHTFVTADTGMRFIKWNSRNDYDFLSDAEIVGDRLAVCGTFEEGFWKGGRETHMIVDKWEVVDND